MGKVTLLMLFILAAMLPAVLSYSVSVPFQVDSGGKPVATAIVGINISEGTNCVSPFYFNKTTAAYGRGQINVSSSRFIASRIYTLCFNSTVNGNVLKGRTTFSPGVGDINVTAWVNGSKARFNSFQLNNGSNFDAVFGRDTNVTTIQITNIIYNGTGIKLQQAFNSTLLKLVNAYNGTLIKLIASYNGTLLKQITAFNGTLIKVVTSYNGTLAKINQVYNGTLAKSAGDVRNNTDAGKLYLNYSNNIFVNSTLQSRKFTLANGSTFDIIYGRSTGISNNTANGKIYLNTSNSNLFVSGNITGRRFYLTNGSTFDVIYGRDSNNQTLAFGLIKNNTAQGKIYLNVTANDGVKIESQGGFTTINITSSAATQRANIRANGRFRFITNGLYEFTDESRTSLGLVLNLAANAPFPFKLQPPAQSNTAALGSGMQFLWTSQPASGDITERLATDVSLTYSPSTSSTSPKAAYAGKWTLSPLGGTNTIGNNAGDAIGAALFLINSLNIRTGNKLSNIYGIRLNYSTWTIAGTIVNATAFYHPGWPGNVTKKWGIYTAADDSYFSNNVTVRGNLTAARLYQGNNRAVINNTAQGKIFLNTSNSNLFVSGNITGRRFYLTNGSTFDVIYGRDNNNQTLASGLIKNNTLQGKVYINSTIFTTLANIMRVNNQKVIVNNTAQGKIHLNTSSNVGLSIRDDGTIFTTQATPPSAFNRWDIVNRGPMRFNTIGSGSYTFMDSGGVAALTLTLTGGTANPFIYAPPTSTATSGDGAALTLTVTQSPASGAIATRYGYNGAYTYSGTSTDTTAKEIAGLRQTARVIGGSNTFGNNKNGSLGAIIAEIIASTINSGQKVGNIYGIRLKLGSISGGGYVENATGLFIPPFSGTINSTYSIRAWDKAEFYGNVSVRGNLTAGRLYQGNNRAVINNTAQGKIYINNTAFTQNFTMKGINTTTFSNCGLYISASASTRQLVCDGVIVT